MHIDCVAQVRRRALRCVAGAAAAVAFVAPNARAFADAHPTSDTTRIDLGSLVPSGRADRVVASAAVYAALARMNKNVPAFSRQTKLACSACHYQFPQLNPFGRLFKLNGYTLTGIPTIGQPGDSAGTESLKLLTIPPIAAMVVASATRTSQAVPGTQNGTAALPEQFSLFMAGQISPNVGAFTQFTYAAADGAFGIDNVDIRYANRRTVNDRELIYGLSLNNNPTVQDVWNTVPAWGFPFMSSSSAPSPVASTLIDGGLGQSVVGLGAYSLFNKMLYTEVTAYRSSPQGATMPLDSSASDVASGLIPYWRIALQHESDATSLMIGTYGFNARVYPAGVTGPTNHYTDVAVDAQIERRRAMATWIGHASYIHERQQLDAFLAAGEATGARQTLSTARGNVAYLPNPRYALTLGFFQTSGTTDTLRYAPAPFMGSNTGSPNTSGTTGEVDYNAWQNTRLGLQYTAYRRFNGSSNSYDIASGRNASGNNTLYFYMWLAF